MPFWEKCRFFRGTRMKVSIVGVVILINAVAGSAVAFECKNDCLSIEPTERNGRVYHKLTNTCGDELGLIGLTRNGGVGTGVKIKAGKTREQMCPGRGDECIPTRYGLMGLDDYPRGSMGFFETVQAYEAECGLIEAGTEQAHQGGPEPSLQPPEPDPPATYDSDANGCDDTQAPGVRGC